MGLLMNICRSIIKPKLGLLKQMDQEWEMGWRLQTGLRLLNSLLGARDGFKQ